MLDGIVNVKPEEIEKKSFEILTRELGDKTFLPFEENIIKRVIHTTADFDYANIMKTSPDAINNAIEAIKSGNNIVTDTNMAKAGINKKVLKSFGGEVICFMDDEEIASKAKEQGVTRASLCMEKACENKKNTIYVVGNAPTALIRLVELIKEGLIKPKLVVGVPVGFVNVVESKEMIKKAGVPYVISEGRKGGSNVAAAIINAILYQVK
jgi:precorrin-8X/cobalt-precorrin-8 methylmutase